MSLPAFSRSPVILGPVHWFSLLLVGWTAACGATVTNLLNIQFGVSSSVVKAGPAGVGLTPTDAWNLYSRDDADGGYRATGTVGDLRWSDGTLSGAGLRVDNAPGAWGNGDVDPMFGTYLYPFNGGPITVTLTNLPPGTYDVLAYGHGGPPDVQNTAFEVQSGGIAHGIRRTSTRPGWASSNWVEDVQYVRFSDVAVFTNHSVVLRSRPDAIAQAVINGMQLLRINDTPVGLPIDPPIDPPITNFPTTNVPPVATNPPPIIAGQSVGLLNVSFGTDAAPTKIGPAAIGQGPEDFWNRYSRDDGHGGYRHAGGMPRLYWANGTLSPAKLAVTNAAGAWANDNPDPMFGAYLYPLSADPILSLGLSERPSGYYSVFAYGHGGPPDEQNTVFELIAGGASLGEKPTSSVPGWNTTNWTEGQQLVVFTNVSVEPGSTLVVLAKPGAYSFGMINGLQLRYDAPMGARIDPAGGLFTNEVAVRILGGGLGREIRYTLDGSVPTTNSTSYRRPIALATAAVVRAQAFAEGEPVGEPVSASFQRVYAVNDGISADWRRQHFGEAYLTDPRVAADADPDGDGASNLQELVAGSNPTDPLSGFIVRTRLVPSISWRSEPGKAYRILRKDQLSDANWILVKEVTATTPFSRFTDEDVANSDSFYTVEPAP
jgi:hypothetical protein